MKTNMTERDKKLLVGMLIGVIIVAIGYWGIIPQIKAYSDLEAKIEKEEEIQKINKLKITNASMIEMQAEEYEKELAKVKDDFYQIMTSAEVDKMLTGLATKRGLNIYELKFNIPTKPTARMAYVNSSLYSQQLALKQEYQDALKKADKAASKTEKEESTESSTSTSSSSKNSSNSSKATSEVMDAISGGVVGGYQPNTEIFAVPVTITVGGEIGALEDFLEEMGQLEKTALLTSYTWGEYRTYVIRDANGNIISATGGNGVNTVVTADGTGVTGEQLVEDTKVRKSLTVRLEVYMCDTSAVTTDENPDGTTEDTTTETTTETME